MVASLILAGITGYNAIKSNQAAGQAASAQSALTAAEIARNEKIMGLYDDGSEEMKKVLEELTNSFDGMDEISSQKFTTMKNYFSTSRILEEQLNEGKIDEEEAADLKMLFGMDADFRGRGQGYQDRGDGAVGGQDAIFNYNSPSTYDMAPQIDRIAGKFINARMANASRAADKMYSKGAADLMRKGMMSDTGGQSRGGGSTLEVELSKSAADFQAQALNKAMVDGMNDAMSYTRGVQETTAGEQLMNLSERKFGQELIGNATDYATANINNEIAYGNYGMDLYNTQNSARSSAISDLSSMYNVRNNTTLTDYITGMDTMNKQSSVFNDYLSAQMNMAASPYKFGADGSTAASFGSALSSSDNLTQTMVANAKNAGGAFGSAWDRYMGYDTRPIA